MKHLKQSLHAPVVALLIFVSNGQALAGAQVVGRDGRVDDCFGSSDINTDEIYRRMTTRHT